MDRKTKEMILEIQKEREALFRKFIEYTDMAERYNRMAYEVTCQIESINLAIREAQDLGVIEVAGETGEKAVSHVPRSASPDEEFEWDLFWEGGAGQGPQQKAGGYDETEPEALDEGVGNKTAGESAED